MTGSYLRGDAEAVLAPQGEAKFDMVTYTYYKQLNGYEHLKQLDIGYYFYAAPYADDILKVLNPAEKTIVHIPSVNSRESTKDKIREVEHIIEELGEWQGTDPVTGFQLVRTPEGRVLRIADLVDDDPSKRASVSAALKDGRARPGTRSGGARRPGGPAEGAAAMSAPARRPESSVDVPAQHEPRAAACSPAPSSEPASGAVSWS